MTLPVVTQLEFDDTDLIALEDSTASIGKSFLFNFETGDFVLRDGKLVEVEGIEAVRIWVHKTILTRRFRFKVYEGTEYGALIEDLIGSAYPIEFIESELDRELKEAFMQHPAITNVSNLSVEHINDKGIVSFTIDTIYGEEPMEVRLFGT